MEVRDRYSADADADGGGGHGHPSYMYISSGHLGYLVWDWLTGLVFDYWSTMKYSLFKSEK